MAEYRNPQQEPGNERRTLVVFAVTFAIIVLAQFFLFKNKPAPVSPRPSTQQSGPTQTTPSVAASPETAAPTSSGSQPAASPGTRVAPGEVETTVETPVYKIIFTNRGAQVKSWILKQYKDDGGKPLDLVNHAAESFGLPLGLYTYDQNLSRQINSALYVSKATSNHLVAPGELAYEYSEGGVVVHKSFYFGDGYVISIEARAAQNGNPVAVYPMWPPGLGDQHSGPSYASSRIDYLASDKVERLAAKKVSGGNTLHGPFSWAGPQDQYFAAIFLPDDPNSAAMVTLRESVTVPKDPNKPDPNNVARYDVLGAAVGDVTGVTKERLFVGPKAVHILESVRSNSAPGAQNGPDLRGAVDFGMFSFIARPLFLWLRWTQQHIAYNWGVSIIILTIIINLALLPLRIASMKSALKMQKLQPQMKAIQDKYKKLPMRDPKRQEMNAELAELYKREGANPAGGCVPLLIQMPFLFAFYSMLGNAIELRHASFLWLHDLSSPDKLFILPVVIVITTYLVQKMTPNAGMDPQQQRMMTLMMPLMIGFFSYSLPSGLSVYWVVGNLIAIAQQWVMNRTSLGKEMRVELEKRARKAKVAK